jgi:hypothetical protein
MHLVAIAWMYVVVAMSIAEAISPAGTLLGATFTFLLYGALPLAIVLYLLGTPGRRRRRAVALDAAAAPSDGAEGTESIGNVEAAASALEPDRRGHAAGDAVAPERKEP